VLARWQDCVASGDLHPKKAVNARSRGKRARRGPQRVAALSSALREALESFIISLADRAAEQVDSRWRESPAGALLLANAAAERARGEQVKQIFESAFGNNKLAATSDLSARADRAVAAWQDHLTQLTGSGKAGAGERKPEALGLVLAVAMLAEGSADAIATEADKQLGTRTSRTGPGSTSQNRADLLDRIRLLFDEELLGYAEVIDAAGPCDDVAAIRLYQAEYSLEAVR
jgi:hypothetical protein